MGSIRLKGSLVARGSAAAVVLGEDHVAAVGEGKKRFPVLATVNGYRWRTTVTRMHGEFLLGLSRDVRRQAHVEVGDTVTLELELDLEPREVEVPQALEDALAHDDRARKAFGRLSYTHRKEYARWIGEAAREETRQRRITRALELLRQGKPRP